MSKAQFPIVNLAQWLESEPGQYVQRWEQNCFDKMVADVFGYHALQIGLPSFDLLRANRMPFKAYAGAELPAVPAADWAGLVLTEPELLPFDSQSVDLLVLPHRTPYLTPWLPQPISAQVSLPRLKDWLKLLSFEIELGHFGCYVPPLRSQKWLDRFAFTEAAGNRWWPVCGAVYVVSAVKRVAGMRLITPRWKSAQPLRKGARQTVGAALQQKTGSKPSSDPVQS